MGRFDLLSFSAAAAAALTTLASPCSSTAVPPRSQVPKPFLVTSEGWGDDVSAHSVRWTSLNPEPGTSLDGLPTYANSMPIGNGHVAGNVNYEAASDAVEIVLAASTAWAEDQEFMKVAHMTVHLPSRGGAALGSGFVQTFNPQDATVTLQVPAGGSAPALTVVAYVDVAGDSAVVSVSPRHPDVAAELTTVRKTAQSRRPNMDCATFAVSADVVSADGHTVYHRNALTPEESYMTAAFQHQNIPVVPGFADPLLNRSTGARLAEVLPSDPTSITFSATVATAQTASAEAFEDQLKAASEAFVAQQQPGQLPPPSHKDFWAAKWNAHTISIRNGQGDNSTDAEVVTQQYVLQRFIELSQAREPGTVIKFNGMMYTANRAPHEDANAWGGLNWWQNLRLPYYNMATAGDLDELMTMLVAFNRTVPVARARTLAYFGFDGIWWPEYTTLFYGTTHPTSYRAGPGCTPQYPGEPTWHSDDRWNGYNRQGSLDLSLMILDHFAYTNGSAESASLLQIPFGVVQFYENLWGNTSDAQGRMVFHPTQVVETWQCPGWPVNKTDCPTNDMPTVAGLHSVVGKLLQLPSQVVTPQQTAGWKQLLEKLPNLPAADGRYVPCADCNRTAPASSPGSHHTSNVENGELYAVHPYRLATVGRGNASAIVLGKAAYEARTFSWDSGWFQTVMDAALLGDANDARQMVVARASTPPAEGYRFPAFAPHEQDYEPSADHLANFATGLQYMLIQRVDDVDESVVLLPAWPCDWDVNFTLHAPKQTTIMGSLVNGTLSYNVSPALRAKTVTALPCQATPAPWSCHVFGCTCQGMSDWYGTDAGIGFGCAPEPAQVWWTGHGCNTRNATYPCANPPSPCDAPACRNH